MLDCYIEIHQSLVDDNGELNDFKKLYTRDGLEFCCGAETQTLPNTKTYCEVCGTEY